MIKGMGHDLPAGALERLADMVADHAHSTDRARAVV